jgi:hypothetical protein
MHSERDMTTRTRIAAFLFCLTVLPSLASAQDTQTAPAKENSPETFGKLPVPSWAQAVVESFSRPVHPVVGGVASGGGLGFGVGYDSPKDTLWYQQAEAMVTLRRYWSLEGEVGRRSLSKRSQIAAFGVVRHMGRLDYYGMGPDSVFDNRTSFRLRETTIGARGWYQLAPSMRLRGSASMYMPDTGLGTNHSVPSIEEVFPISTVPGYGAEPTFGRYRGAVEFLHPAAADFTVSDETNGLRGAFQVGIEAVRDLDSGRYDFQRYEAELRQQFPGMRPSQRLTLHGIISTTNADAEVPFYMLHTIGGGGGFKSFHPDLFGTDGTNATLRGFRNFRFRDRNLVLMQAEYRIPLHKYVHSTVFVDAGQVAPTTSELFDHLRTSVGFSLGYMHKGKSLGRMDVGFGGGEGVRVFWSFGAFD